MSSAYEREGMTVEQAMKLVNMMASELDLVEFKVPLGKGKACYLYLPRDFRIKDAQRLSGWIKLMVTDEEDIVKDKKGKAGDKEKEKKAKQKRRQLKKGDARILKIEEGIKAGIEKENGIDKEPQDNEEMMEAVDDMIAHDKGDRTITDL
jgi:hypothetical protein